MSRPGRRKTKKSLMLRLLTIGFALYAAITLIETQVQIADRRRELEEIEAQTEVMRIQNKEISRLLAMGDDQDYIERIAKKKLDYVSPDERIFIDSSGN